MNSTTNQTVEFIEKNAAEMAENVNLAETIATLAMDSADYWL